MGRRRDCEAVGRTGGRDSEAAGRVEFGLARILVKIALKFLNSRTEEC